MFNWDDLRSFIEVTRANSLSKAANKLGVNHTTVARRIQALEESLGARLFDKTPAGYLLTATGTQLLALAEQVETTCISAQEIFSARNDEPSGVVRISVPEGFGCHFLIKQLNEFYRRYPAIELEIQALRETLSIPKREADIVITVNQPSAGRLITRELTKCVSRLYATRQYLERSSPVLRLQDLRRHRLIGNIDDAVNAAFYGKLSNDSFDHELFNELLANVHIGLRVKSCNAQLIAVESGLGLGLLPCYSAAGSRELVSVLRDEANLRYSCWMAMHEDMRHVRRVTAVWNWLKTLIAAHQPTFLGTWEEQGVVPKAAPWRAA